MVFETKDSGKREEFASGMVRDTQNGKVRFDLALDGPLFWALFAGTPKAQLVKVAQDWYEFGGIDRAAKIIEELGKLEGGLFVVIERYAALMTRGAVKYEEHNWLRAQGEAEYKRFRSSFSRHFCQYLRGDIDEDHMAGFVFNLNGTEYVRIKTESKIPL